MSRPIRLLLADDHPVLREGLAELLRQRSNLEVVGQASTGRQTVELTHTLKPDVVLMDIEMPDMTGIEATRQIRALLPNVKILILSGYDQEAYFDSASKMGAHAYLVKTSSVEQVVRTIERIYRDGYSHDSLKLTPAVELRSANGSKAEPEQGYSLTAREIDVLHLLSLGLTNRAIAKTLSISDRTVQAHLTHIFAKMHVTCRLDAVLKAMRDETLTSAITRNPARKR